MKRCPKCGTTKNIDLFFNNKERKDGKDVYCKDCRTQYTRDNKERMVANTARWNKSHPEEAKEHQRNYKKSHTEKLNAIGRAWRLLFPEKSRAASNLWKQNHPEEHLSHWRNRRALIRGNGGKITAQEWASLKEKYNYTCLCCGKREPEIKLTLDHVLPLKLGGMNVIENAQPLCGICNSSKGAKHVDYRKSTLFRDA